MNNPSPFDIGRSIGTNFGQLSTDLQDTNAIDRILKQQYNQQDPNAINEILSQLVTQVSPTGRQQGLDLFGAQQKNRQAQGEQQTYQKLARNIEEAQPGNTNYKLMSQIYESSLPSDQKASMIKSIQQTLPYQEAQQLRLNLDSARKNFDSRLKQMDADIDRARPKDRPALENQKKLLLAERDRVLGFDKILEKSIPKQIFDMNNPEHAKRSAEALNQANGNKEEAARILAEEFD